MNLETILVAAFPVLLFMVVVWFVLIKLLFNRVEKFHPQKYEAMGRPSLFMRNTINGGLATLKFLVAREHKVLNDAYLSKLSDFMLVFIVIYLLIFFGLFYAVAAQGPSRAV
jgi:hypothetical protein